jgi:hypothetical protein
MNTGGNTMNIEERVALHGRMAEGYRNAYLHQEVQEGVSYEEWKFAHDAVYSSPYFTGETVLLLRDVPIDAAKSATMEAKAYALTFPDWKPADFRYWPAANGFVMKTRWQGHTTEGTTMGFYSYGFVDTNDEGEVTRWETHVNDEYSRFLEVAIGVSGPFTGNEYMDALARCLEAAGESV